MKQDAKSAKRAYAKEVKRARLHPASRTSFVLPICIGLLFVAFVYAAFHIGSVSQAKALASKTPAIANAAPRASNLSVLTAAAGLSDLQSISLTPSDSGAANRQPEVHANGSSDRLDTRSGTDEAVSLFGYDPNGNVISETDARGAVTTHLYDALDRKIRTTYPDLGAGEQTESWNYDLIDNLISHIDRNGIAEGYAYDQESRLLAVSRDGVTIEQRTLDVVGNIIAVTDANGNTTRTKYDLANRPIEVTAPNGEVMKSTYDGVSNLLTLTDGAGRTTTYAYDLRRRKISETNAAGEVTRYAHDGVGNVLTSTNPIGTWTYTYDDANRLKTVLTPEQHVTSYSYDKHSNLVTVKDANGNITTLAYNARNKLSNLTHPNSDAESYSYDANDNRTGRIDANGVAHTMEFDALNRQTKHSAPTSIATQAASTVVSYDGNGNVLSNVETLGDGSQKTELNQYDARDRLIQTIDRNNRLMKFGYDAASNQISYTDADGSVTTREFDAKNRLVKVVRPTLGAVALAYTGADELKTITHPNGTETNRTYDQAGRMASVTVNQGAVTVAQRVYTFDANGNRLTQVEKNGGAAETSTYEYDLDNRLTKVVGPDQTENYTIDPAGNRKTEVVKSLSNVVLANKTYTYNAREQLVSVADGANITTYLYDGNGNQTSVKIGAAPATLYTWGPRDQLASLSTGEAFEYDSAGHRTAKTGGGNRTLYIWSGDDLMAETNTIGNSLSQYTRAGSLLLGEVRNGVAQHFDQDAFNSVIVTTLADGTVPGRLSYRAFGQVRSSTGLIESPFRFNGYVSDGGDELSSPSRYYSLGTGRFTSMDPAAPTQMNPLSWNAYVGLGANPMRNTDPSGRCFWDGCIGEVLVYGALSGVLAWEASVIHQEVTENADFATAASNPRNIVNGVAVGGTVASGGLLGPLVTSGVMVAGGGLSAAHQYVDTGDVTAGQTFRGSVLASGMVGGFAVGGVLAPTMTQAAGVGLLGYSAADSGQRLGAGIANGDAPRSLLAVSDLALTVAGGRVMFARPKIPGAATPLTVAESSSGGSRLMASIDAELEIGISQKGIDVNHANVDIPFGTGVKQQGFAYEDYLAIAQAADNRLAPGTKTFDFYDQLTGAATSAKTLNTLSAAKLNNPKQVYSALRPYINATADFVKATIPKSKPLLDAMINSKTIKVAVPVGTTSAQWAQLKRAIDYANENGVKLEIETANTKQ